MKLKLTDVTIRNLPIPEKGQKAYYDLTFPTLAVRVSQGGTKTFVLEVGKRGQRTLKTLGRYPTLSLADARSRARLMLITPEQTGSPTFGEAIQAYLSVATLQMSTSHSREVARILNTIFQNLHALTLTTVTTKHVTDIIDKLTKTTPGQALHVHNRIKTFFRWCRMRNLLTVNPIEFLPPPSKYIPRDRILTDSELAAIWHACPKLGTFGRICQLLVCTGQRRGQIAALHRDWIQSDCIIFPASIMKTRAEHVLPIGPLTRSLLPDRDGLLFPSGDGTLYCAWSKPKRQLEKLSGVQNFVIHDFRRYFRTTLSALGCSPDIAERLVAHRVGTEVSRIYDRYQFAKEKNEAVARYEERLRGILSL